MNQTTPYADELTAQVSAQLPPDAIRYLNELAADIVAHGGMEGRDPIQAMQDAHDRRQAFAAEMAAQSSERSKLVARVMCAQVFGQINAQAGVDRVLRQIEGERTTDVVARLRAGLA